MSGKGDRLAKRLEKHLVRKGVYDTDQNDHYQVIVSLFRLLQTGVEIRREDLIRRTVGKLYIRLQAYMLTVKGVSEKSWYRPFIREAHPKREVQVDQEWLQEMDKALELDNRNFMDVETFSLGLTRIARNHGFTYYDCVKPLFKEDE